VYDNEVMLTSCLVVVVAYLLQLQLLGTADAAGVLSNQTQRDDANVRGGFRLPSPSVFTNARAMRWVQLKIILSVTYATGSKLL